MNREDPVVVLRLAVDSALTTLIPIVSAREWMARERADWDPHYGDPDGESIVQVFGILVGAGVFLAVAAVLAGLELALWRRRRADRAATHMDDRAWPRS